MLSERDRNLYDFICKLGFISIEAAAEIFYKKRADGAINISRYEIARKRLSVLKKLGYIKEVVISERNNKIFISADEKYSQRRKKRYTESDYIVLEFISRIKGMGAEILYFDIEKNYESLNGYIRPDLTIIFKFNNKLYKQVLEVQLRHDKVDVNKYDVAAIKKLIYDTAMDINENIDLDNLGISLEKLLKIKFKIVIIQNTRFIYPEKNLSNINIIQLDRNMNNIESILN